MLTTPVIRWLNQQIPGVEIHYLTKDPFKDLIRYHPGVQKLITIKRDVREVLPELQKERYDLVVDLHNNLRSRQTTWKLKTPRLRVKKYTWQRFLLVEFKKLNALPLHVVNRYETCLASLGTKMTAWERNCIFRTKRTLAAPKLIYPKPLLERSCWVQGILPNEFLPNCWNKL